MISFRPFRNDDPPAIAEIWGTQPPSRGLMQPMTPAVFDQTVLSKPYFDRNGLTVAVDGERPVGLVQAGFGVAADRSGLDRRRGVICLLMVAPHSNQAQIACELVRCAEQYLAERGAIEFHAGCCEGINPFYLGIYGGSGTPGILTTDTVALRAFEAMRYEPQQQRCVHQRDLATLRVPVDRKLMELRRKLQLEFVSDSAPADWWEAVTFSHIDRVRSQVGPRGGSPWATASFWDIEPLASTWGVHAVGLLRIGIETAASEPDPVLLSTHILAESFRSIQSQGITLAEIQTLDSDQTLIEICRRLGFTEVTRGVSLKKPLSAG